ncbi:MAG: hypothetical protein ACE366_08000 [Bradymonadia bacterium]
MRHVFKKPAFVAPTLTTLLALSTWGCGCSPAPPKPTAGGAGDVKMVEVTEQDLILGFAQEKNRDHDDFSEMYVLRGKLDNGGTIYTRLRVTNFGPSADGRAAFTCHVTMPDETRHSFWLRRDDRKWKWGNDGLMADLKGAKVTGGVGHFEAEAEKDGRTLSLKVTSTHKPLQPIPPNALVGGESFYQAILMIPHGKIEGTVTLKNGEKIEFTGGGHMEIRRTNVAPHHLGRRFFTLQDISADQTVHIWGVTLTEDLGGNSSGFALKANNDTIEAYAPMLALEAAEWEKHKKSGYSVPQTLALKPAKGEGLTASVKAGELKEVKDELKNLSWIERTVAERFAKPFSYKHTSDYSITVPGKEGAEPVTIEGKADYTYQRLN